MKDHSSEEALKWVQLKNVLQNEPLIEPFHFIWIKQWFFDNGLIFFIQLTGFLLNQYIAGYPLIILVPGIGLALLFLKGNAILPGLMLSALLSDYLSGGNLNTAFLFAFHQIAPLLLFKYYVYHFIGATLVDLSLRQQGLLYIGAFLTVALISNVPYEASNFFANLNGLLIASTTVLAADLYCVDWLQLGHKKLRPLLWALFCYATGIISIFLTVKFMWPLFFFFPASLLVVYGLKKNFELLGLISAIFMFGFMQLCLSFFCRYELNVMLPLQVFLFLNFVFSMFLVKRKK